MALELWPALLAGAAAGAAAGAPLWGWGLATLPVVYGLAHSGGELEIVF